MIEPIAHIYEAFATAALFLLILEWTCPDGMDRERFFNNLELRDKQGNVQPGGSLKWFQVRDHPRAVCLPLPGFSSSDGRTSHSAPGKPPSNTLWWLS